MSTPRTLALLTCALALGAGCSSDAFEEPAAADTAAERPAAPGTVPAGLAALSRTASDDVTGEVAETMDSGGYTYVRVDVGPASVWAAGPIVSVSVGDTVSFDTSLQMTDHHSKTLGRTFDRIYFARAIQVVGAGPGAAVDAPVSAGTPNAGVTPVVEVEPAEGGVTVEQVFARRAELVGTEIVLRGEVVKYNAGILGANWLHIQDGTGAAGTDDLTVTTAATAKVGDTVTVRGVLAADKDFGYGYVYDLIVEDAQVSVD